MEKNDLITDDVIAIRNLAREYVAKHHDVTNYAEAMIGAIKEKYPTMETEDVLFSAAVNDLQAYCTRTMLSEWADPDRWETGGQGDLWSDEQLPSFLPGPDGSRINRHDASPEQMIEALERVKSILKERMEVAKSAVINYERKLAKVNNTLRRVKEYYGNEKKTKRAANETLAHA